ncbi:MAG: polysaccharide deacetylase family protein [candidate division Zixibacteria bacterium]|nr:polysaccharide deacetylase family protein [candidate division Zixibacteria bacterium]
MITCRVKFPKIFFEVILILLIIPAFLFAQSQKTKKNKKICITFDELPVATSFAEPAKDTITNMILSTLKKHNIKAAGFVVGSKIEANYDLLGRWLNAGHRLGNLTYSYNDYHQLEPTQFITDIVTGNEALEPMLSGFGQKPRFFRFPFLHYGDDLIKKREVTDFLDEYNILTAHVTVTVEDYLYNLTVEKNEGVFDSTQFYELMNEYVNHVLDEIERSELLSKEVLKRSCRQILQLRANHLNALFLDEMLTQIEKLGYEFVTLDYALRDKLYSAPEAYTGSVGMGYLDMLKHSDPDLLPAE